MGVILLGAAMAQGSLGEAALRSNDPSFHQEEKNWDNTFSKKLRKLSKNWKNISTVHEINIEPWFCIGFCLFVCLFSLLWSCQKRYLVTPPLWFSSGSGLCEERVLILVRSFCFHFEVHIHMYSYIKHYALSTHLEAVGYQ